MKRLLALRPSPAVVISCVALFVSLGGVSYGVATGYIDSREIKNNSVSSKDLRNNGVAGKDLRNGSATGADVKNDSLKGADVLESSLGTVPSAAEATHATAADTADTAVTAAPIAYARIAGDGVVDDAQSKSIASANVTNPSAGRYCFNGLSFTPKSVQVTTQLTVNRVASATTEPYDHFSCTGAEDAEVTFVTGGGNVPVNTAFFVVFH